MRCPQHVHADACYNEQESMLASCQLSRGPQVFDVHDKHQVHVSHGRGRWGAPIKHALFLLTPLRRATGFAFPKVIGESPSKDSNDKCCGK